MFYITRKPLTYGALERNEYLCSSKVLYINIKSNFINFYFNIL